MQNLLLDLDPRGSVKVKGAYAPRERGDKSLRRPTFVQSNPQFAIRNPQSDNCHHVHRAHRAEPLVVPLLGCVD
jgi:hypothetical protein